LQYFIGVAAGVIVGFSLALVGGGGSILAVPLIVYAVGVTDPHLAVGTSALAVAANAVAGLASHARAATVRWKIAGVFAVLMLLVGVLMLRIPPTNGDSPADLGRVSVARLMMVGALTGAVSGFFGIGGGFLIVPGLMYAAHLPILEAVGSALVAVAAFGLTTAVNYARSGWIDWPVAAVFIGGGTLGSVAGTRFARRLAARQGALNRLYAAVVFLVALYMLFRSVTGNS
jgi:hypothetical protein